MEQPLLIQNPKEFGPEQQRPLSEHMWCFLPFGTAALCGELPQILLGQFLKGYSGAPALEEGQDPRLGTRLEQGTGQVLPRP